MSVGYIFHQWTPSTVYTHNGQTVINQLKLGVLSNTRCFLFLWFPGLHIKSGLLENRKIFLQLPPVLFLINVTPVHFHDFAILFYLFNRSCWTSSNTSYLSQPEDQRAPNGLPDQNFRTAEVGCSSTPGHPVIWYIEGVQRCRWFSTFSSFQVHRKMLWHMI